MNRRIHAVDYRSLVFLLQRLKVISQEISAHKFTVPYSGTYNIRYNASLTVNGHPVALHFGAFGATHMMDLTVGDVVSTNGDILVTYRI